MKVSILIPVYNSEKYLAETIRSALDQTWQYKEIIVVDDGSTDNSLQIARSFETVNSNVKVFSQTNGGACKARNRAFAESAGEYIQFLDADDILSPTKIEKQMLLLQERDEYVVASCLWAKFTNDINQPQLHERYINRGYTNPKQWLIDSWEGKGIGQTSIWLCHRNLLKATGEWDETLKLNQDGEYFSRVLLKASEIRFCDEAVVYYRSANMNSISKGRSYEKASSLLKTYLLYKQNMLPCDNSYEARHALMKNFLNFIYEYYPSYADLINTADQNIKELGFEKYEVTGGKNFRKLAKIIGFYPALKLRNLLSGK